MKIGFIGLLVVGVLAHPRYAGCDLMARGKNVMTTTDNIMGAPPEDGDVVDIATTATPNQQLTVTFKAGSQGIWHATGGTFTGGTSKKCDGGVSMAHGLTGSTVTWTAPSEAGSYTLSFAVASGQSKITRESVTVVVAAAPTPPTTKQPSTSTTTKQPTPAPTKPTKQPTPAPTTKEPTKAVTTCVPLVLDHGLAPLPSGCAKAVKLEVNTSCDVTCAAGFDAANGTYHCPEAGANATTNLICNATETTDPGKKDGSDGMSSSSHVTPLLLVSSALSLAVSLF